MSFDLFGPTPTAPTVWGYNDFFALTPTAYCLTTVSTAWGYNDLFALKVPAPATLICWVHCFNWPFCTNTYCIHCVHCIRVQWPFCTESNSPHHPYLLSTLCHLTFLDQHLLCPLHGGKMTFCTNTYCVLPNHCVHCVGVQWPFCTKGTSPRHPYLLSTLFQLTFLH